MKSLVLPLLLLLGPVPLLAAEPAATDDAAAASTSDQAAADAKEAEDLRKMASEIPVNPDGTQPALPKPDANAPISDRPATASADTPARAGGDAAPGKDADQDTQDKEDTFVPSVQISEDLSVAFPVDI